MNNTMERKLCAEVVETSLRSFRAQCHKWNMTPEFGQLVIAEDKEKIVYGIVNNITTESLDPIGAHQVYEKTEDDLMREYPHIFEFLRTKCTILILGYKQNGSSHFIYQHATPTPVYLYTPVFIASEKEIVPFFSCDQYIDSLIYHLKQTEQSDDLLYATIKILKKFALFSEKICLNLITQYTTNNNISYNNARSILTQIERL